MALGNCAKFTESCLDLAWICVDVTLCRSFFRSRSLCRDSILFLAAFASSFEVRSVDSWMERLSGPVGPEMNNS